MVIYLVIFICMVIFLPKVSVFWIVKFMIIFFSFLAPIIEKSGPFNQKWDILSNCNIFQLWNQYICYEYKICDAISVSIQNDHILLLIGPNNVFLMIYDLFPTLFAPLSYPNDLKLQTGQYFKKLLFSKFENLQNFGIIKKCVHMYFWDLKF